MSTVSAYAASDKSGHLTKTTIERRDVGPHDVAIDIKFAGICHSDIHTVKAEWGGPMYPVVPGHEIAGVVTEVGSDVTKYKVGDHVGVGCMVDSCRECEQLQGRPASSTARKARWSAPTTPSARTAPPTYGGYSQAIVVDENYVLRIPDSDAARRRRAAAVRGHHAVLAAAPLEGRTRQEGRDRRARRPRPHGRQDRRTRWAPR